VTEVNSTALTLALFILGALAKQGKFSALNFSEFEGHAERSEIELGKLFVGAWVDHAGSR
jgi:hypothetical protein